MKYGADWIKYYSDRRYFVKDGALRSMVNFTAEEAKALVDEAHRLGRKVAAHAMGHDGIESALEAGADTIEHGFGLDDEMLDVMARRGVFWCPTIYVGVYVAEGLGTVEPGRFADVIAVNGDPLRDVAELEKVVFVMKGGQVFRAP